MQEKNPHPPVRKRTAASNGSGRGRQAIANLESELLFGARSRIVLKYVLAALILFSLIYLLSPFFMAITVGLVIAVTADPLHKLLCRWKALRPLAPAIIVAVLLLVFLIPAGVIVVRGSEALVAFFQQNLMSTMEPQPGEGAQLFQLPDFVNVIGQRIAEFVDIPFETLAKALNIGFQQIGRFIFALFQNFLKELPDSALGVFVATLTVYFCLRNQSELEDWLRLYSPFSRHRMDQLASAIRNSCNTVIVSNIVGGAVQSAIFVIGAVVLGTGQLFLLGFSVFLLSFIPIFGTAPISLGLALNNFILGETGKGIAWLVIGLVAGLSDNVTKPYVVSRGVKIHPFLGLLTVLGAMALLGVPGLFIDPLVAGLFTTCLPILLKPD